MKRLTIVLTHTPFSTSHVRTVESNPQLYALAPLGSRPKTTRETRAVWLLSTAVGALRFAPPVPTDNISTSALDATQFGPACPQMNVSLPSRTAHAIALTDSVRLSPQ